ncbi:MAG: VCBS repeat-containing protein, partial [Cyclobacteriaceae bacterium]|nr:VCBS repeat-containing protein [Cyclobacteriaceae bacterium]
LSQYTPGIAIADIDQDGLEDMYIGGNGLFPGSFLIQDKMGNFNKENRIILNDELLAKDMGILFFDADGDKDDDLYVVSGGIEKPVNDVFYTDRLYFNDGLGLFSYNKSALPDLRKSGSCVKAADFDKDGDLDLFVGTRSKPGEYPFSEPSHILLNDHGIFSDATNEICPGLNTPEMVTDAIWTDFDNDQWIDLIVVGEWMDIKFYKNTDGKLIDVSKTALPFSSSGWWNCIAGCDIDDDGDTDYICGNLGTNSIFKGTNEYPLTIYAKDFDLNGIVDPIIVKYGKDEHFEMQPFPIYTRDDLLTQVAILRQRVSTYRDFGRATITELFTPDELEESYKREGSHFESSILINNGNGKFQLNPLPVEAQMAPVFGIVTQDFNLDGFTDLLLVGNDYSLELMTGRIDASNGQLLLGKGDGNFKALKPYESGFIVKGDAKGIVSLFNHSENQVILTTQNKDSLITHSYLIENNNKIIDPKDASWAHIKLKNGRTRKHEFYYGSSYLSQSSRKMIVLDYYKEIVLHQQNTETTISKNF